MNDANGYDCIVIGGGPAGATCGAVLGMHGRRVLILERDKFPRHHVGESLMPQTYWTFRRIGMLEKLKASQFVSKESVQFVNATGKESLPYYFTDRDPHECSTTWQVPRDVFDRMMLDNAREKGAEIREGIRVTRVLMDGDKAVGVCFRDEQGNEQTLHCRVVVDATGTASMLSKQLDLRFPDPNLRNAAIYGYYKGAYRETGRNAGATLVISTKTDGGWFWYIPLPDDVTSVGVVGPPSHLCSGRGDDPARTFEEEVAACEGLKDRLADARRVGKVYVTSDFSYRSRRIAGDGWVLVGDAFGFLDPVYSSGVMLALVSGEWAADAIHEGLSAGDLSGERLGRFGPTLVAGLQRMRQLVHAFYHPAFNFGAFMRQHPQYKDHLVRLLIGDVFKDDVDAIFGPMREWLELPEPIALEGSDKKAMASSPAEV